MGQGDRWGGQVGGQGTGGWGERGQGTGGWGSGGTGGQVRTGGVDSWGNR